MINKNRCISSRGNRDTWMKITSREGYRFAYDSRTISTVHQMNTGLTAEMAPDDGRSELCSEMINNRG